MKVQSISVYNVRRTLVNQPKLKDTQPQETTQNQPSFKGDKGAVIGVFGGALLGVLTTAAIVATGGLAGRRSSYGRCRSRNSCRWYSGRSHRRCD